MLDPFYLIVDSSQWLDRLLPLGVKLVQLRAKDLSAAQARREIAAAKALCAEHKAQLVVNDYWQAALDLGCDYVHLGQEDLERAGVKLGLSTHNEAELSHALRFAPDYVALGPIYPTILKKMPWAPQGLDRITLWKQNIGSVPLVAIGGFNVERAAGAFAAGADSVAVVTDVTLDAAPEQRVRQWLAQTMALRQAKTMTP